MTAKPTSRTPTPRALVETVRDNPVAVRDVTTRLRSRAGLIAACGGALVPVAGAAFVVYLAAERETRMLTWHDPSAYGRPLVATVVVLALLLSLFGLSLSAAVGLASERERGTLDLLRTSALTPGQIVVGKALAALGGFAPALLTVPPLLALGAWLGDVSAMAVASFSLALVVHAVAVTAVGLLAGAWASRARTASLPAVVGASLLVGVPVTLPLLTFAIAWTGGLSAGDVLPGVASSLAAALLVTGACLLGARRALAPAAFDGRRERRHVTLAALVVAPVLVAPTLAVLPEAKGDAWANVLLAGWLFAWLTTVVVEVAASARPLAAWARVTGLALLGTGATAVVATLALVVGDPALLLGDVAPVAGASVVSLSLGLSCAAALTGVVSTFVRTRLARVTTAGGALVLLAVAPVALGFVAWALGAGSGALPLISLNPLAQIASVAPELDLLDLPWRARHLELWGAQVPTLVPGVAAYAALLAVGAAVMGGRRTG